LHHYEEERGDRENKKRKVSLKENLEYVLASCVRCLRHKTPSVLLPAGLRQEKNLVYQGGS